MEQEVEKLDGEELCKGVKKPENPIGEVGTWSCSSTGWVWIPAV